MFRGGVLPFLFPGFRVLGSLFEMQKPEASGREAGFWFLDSP